MTSPETAQNKMSARLDWSKLPRDGVVWAAKFSSCGMRKFSTLGLGVSLTFSPKSGSRGPPTSASSSDVNSAAWHGAGGEKGSQLLPPRPRRARLHSAPVQGRHQQPGEQRLVSAASRRHGEETAVTHRPPCHSLHDVRPLVPSTHSALPPHSCGHHACPGNVPRHVGPSLQRAQSAPSGKSRAAGYCRLEEKPAQPPPCSAWGRIVNYIVEDCPADMVEDCPPDMQEKTPLLTSSFGDIMTQEVEQNNSSIYSCSLAGSPLCQLEPALMEETAEPQVSDLSPTRPERGRSASVSHTSTAAAARPNPHRSRSAQRTSSPLCAGPYPIVTRPSRQPSHDVIAARQHAAAARVTHVRSAPVKDRNGRAAWRTADVGTPDGASDSRRPQEPDDTRHTKQTLRLRTSGSVRPASVFAQELWYRKGRKLLVNAVPQTRAEPTPQELDEDPDFAITRLTRPTVSSQSRQVALPYRYGGQDAIAVQLSPSEGTMAGRFMGKKTVTVQQLHNMVQRLSYCTPAHVPDSSYSHYRAKGGYSRL